METKTADKKILNIAMAIGIVLTSGSLFLWSLSAVSAAHAATPNRLPAFSSQGYTVAGIIPSTTSPGKVAVIGYSPDNYPEVKVLGTVAY